MNLLQSSSKWFQTVCSLCRSPFPFPLPGSVIPARSNSNRATIARIGRAHYLRQYPTLVALPDGSTINIRYKEPRKIIQLPIDLTALTEEEQRARLAKRRPKTVIKVEEEIAQNFNPADYLKRKKKK